jgi:hypothetical protein
VDRRPRRSRVGWTSRRHAFARRVDGRVAASALGLLVLLDLLITISRRRSESPTREFDGSGADDYDWAAPQGHCPDPETHALGVTHTKYSIGNWGNKAANASASAVLTAPLQQVLADRAAADPMSWPVPGVGLVRGCHALLLAHIEGGQVEVNAAGSLRLAPYEMRYVSLTPESPADPPRPEAYPPSRMAATMAARCLRPVPVPQQLSFPEPPR